MTARASERIAGFAVAVLVSAATGAEGLGAVSVAMSVYAVLAIAGEAGTTNYLIREVSRDQARTSVLLLHVGAIASTLALTGTGGLLLVVPHLGYSTRMEACVTVMALGVLPRVLNTLQEAIFVAHGRVDLQARTAVVFATAQVGAAAVLLGRGSSVVAVLTAYVLLQALLTIVYFVLVFRVLVRMELRFSWATTRRVLREMKSFTAASALGALFARPEVVILSLLATDRQLGYYGAAVRLVELPLIVTQSLLTNVLPVLSQADGDLPRFRTVQRSALRFVAAYALTTSVVLVLAGGPLVQLLFGDELAGAAQVVALMAPTIALASVQSLLWRSLAALGRQDAVVKAQLAALAVRLPLAVALAALWGERGAALVVTAATAWHVLLLSRSAGRAGAAPALVRTTWRFGVPALVVMAMEALVTSLLPWLVVVVIGGVGYIGLVLLCKGVGPEERDALRSFRRRVRAGRA